MACRTLGIIGFFVVALAGTAAIQAQAPPPGLERKEQLLTIQRSANERRQRALPKHGNASDVAPLMRYLRSAGSASAHSPALQEAVLEDQAQSLILSGYSPARVKALEARGLDVAAAVKADFLGTLEQYTILAPTVVVGTVTSIRDDAQADGFLSTVSVRVEETLKGAREDVISLRQRSGLQGNDLRVQYSNELDEASVGTKFLLFLSAPMYTAEAHRMGSGPAGNFYTHQRIGYEIKDDSLVPFEIGPPDTPRNLADAKRRISAVTTVLEVADGEPQ